VTTILKAWKEILWIVRMLALEAASFFLPIVVSLSNPLCTSSSHSKCLSLTQIITTSILVNRTARQLEGNIGKYAGEVSITVPVSCGGNQSLDCFLCPQHRRNNAG
jgi:hypothetical protein